MGKFSAFFARLPRRVASLRESLQLAIVLGPLLAFSFYLFTAQIISLISFIAIGICTLWVFFMSGVMVVGLNLQWRDSFLVQFHDELYKVKALRWDDFERLVAEVFRRRGYGVKHVSDGGPDAGIDLVLKRKDGERIAVQCKLRRYDRVDVADVRGFLGAMLSMEINQGYFVTNGGYTEDAEALSQDEKERLCLIDGERLLSLINNSRDEDEFAEASSLGYLLQKSRSLKPPPCPRCGADMRLVKPKRHQRFWGCPSWPICNGKRTLSDYDKEVLRNTGVMR